MSTRRILLISAVVLVAGAAAYGGILLRRCGTAKAGANRVASYDHLMSQVCRFSCAEKREYAEAEVAPQPGARPGQLTRCPVSGVVFASDEFRPSVAERRGAYTLCCDVCARKFRADPGRFVAL